MLFRKLWTRIHSGWRKLLMVSKNLKSVFRYICQSVSYCVHREGGPMWPLPMVHWISSCRNNPCPYHVQIRPHSTGTISTQLWFPSPILPYRNLSYPPGPGHVQICSLWSTYAWWKGGWHPTGMFFFVLRHVYRHGGTSLLEFSWIRYWKWGSEFSNLLGIFR